MKKRSVKKVVCEAILFFLMFGILIALLIFSFKAVADKAAAVDEVMQLEKQIQAEIEVRKAAETSRDILAYQIEAYKSVNAELIKRLNEKEETAEEPPVNKKERLPEGMTNTLRYMDYRTITDETSNQHALQQQCKTGRLTGIRRIVIDDTAYFCAALGSAYGQDIGDTWRVTLKCGSQFNIILAECKDDGTEDFFGHPDENYDGQKTTNVIEFVVDENELPSTVKSAGTFTAHGYYGGLYGDGGNVVKMEYTGRKWQNE